MTRRGWGGEKREQLNARERGMRDRTRGRGDARVVRTACRVRRGESYRIVEQEEEFEGEAEGKEIKKCRFRAKVSGNQTSDTLPRRKGWDEAVRTVLRRARRCELVHIVASPIDAREEDGQSEGGSSAPFGGKRLAHQVRIQVHFKKNCQGKMNK